MSKSQAAEEYWDNGEVDQATKTKHLQLIWTGNVRAKYFWLSGLNMPQVTREEMQHTRGLVIKG